ncbi:hypothetical protein, partial [Streptomyces phaeochromogenes]
AEDAAPGGVGVLEHEGDEGDRYPQGDEHGPAAQAVADSSRDAAPDSTVTSYPASRFSREAGRTGVITCMSFSGCPGSGTAARATAH